MKHNIIQTDNYLLIVDDSEIKEGDFLYSVNNKLVVCANKGSAVTINSKSFSAIIYKKIIAHLPLNNSPILEGVDLLPPLEQEDDVEKLVINEVGVDGEIYNKYDCETFIKGYNKAKEKYKITLEKMIDLYIEETGYGMDMWSKEENNVMIIMAKIIQSLSQPKYPIAFECEIEQLNNKPGSSYEMITRYKSKTTTNSKGQTILVGKYIY